MISRVVNEGSSIPFSMCLSRRALRSFSLLAATAGASWYGMMVVHESGHVLAAWLSGGRVSRVVLDPLGFSRTDVSVNPHPVLVAYAGAVWGSALPLAAWLCARSARLRLAFLFQAFAGFCLLANGAYLASAGLMPVGDAEDLLLLGAPLWLVVAPGLVGFVGGLAVWNGLGRRFGFKDQPVDRAAIIAAATALAILLVGMIVWTSTTSIAS